MGGVGGGGADDSALPSDGLIHAALRGDINWVSQSLMSQAVDVNYIGTVSLRVKCLELLLREEEADEIEIQYRDFVTDVTPLFAAAHSGHASIVRKLLVRCHFGFFSSSCFLLCYQRSIYSY